MAPNFACFNYLELRKRLSLIKVAFLSGLLQTNGTSYKRSENGFYKFSLDIFIRRFNGDFLTFRSQDHRTTKHNL